MALGQDKDRRADDIAPTLESTHLKLDRAWKHLTGLEDEVGAFLKRRPHEFDYHFDENLRIFYVWVTPTEQPPSQWSIVVGDVLHNLNSALDHLVCSLARLTYEADECLTTEFPIYTDRDLFEKKRNRLLANVPLDAQKVIEQLQPFQSPEDPSAHVLEILRRFYNIDKHRRLHLVASNAREALYTPSHPDIEPLRMYVGPVRQRTELAALHVPRHVEGIGNVDIDAVFDVVIDEQIGPEDFQTPNISDGLRSIHYWISNEIVPRFEGFFQN